MALTCPQRLDPTPSALVHHLTRRGGKCEQSQVRWFMETKEPAHRLEELKAAANKASAKSDFAAAAQSLTEAIRLAPKQKELYSNRAFAFSSLGKHAEALADAKHCMAIAPAFSKGYLRAGRALVSLGRPEEAAELLEDAVDRMPQDYALQEALSDAIAAANSKDTGPSATTHSSLLPAFPASSVAAGTNKDGGLNSSYYYAAVGADQRKLPVAPPSRIETSSTVAGAPDVKAVANGAIRKDIDRKGADSYYYAHDRKTDFTVPTVPKRLNPDGSMTPWDGR